MAIKAFSKSAVYGEENGKVFWRIHIIGRINQWNTDNERIRSSQHYETLWSIWDSKFTLYGIRTIIGWIIIWIHEKESNFLDKRNLNNYDGINCWCCIYAFKEYYA